jgi:rhomboid protease GluP
MSRGVGGDWVVKSIITVNVLLFAVSLLLHHSRGHFTPSQTSLFLLGASGTYPIDRFGRIWTVVSANYLHGGILHILFNMMSLRQIAPLVANEYGTSRMFTIYTLGGVLGYLVSYLAGVPFTIGASAAVCSLIGALLYFGRSRGGVYGSSIYREVSGWVISLFIFGFIFPGINNWAHGGGLAGGIILGFLLGYEDRRKSSSFHDALAVICALVTVFVLVRALAGSLT